MGTLEDAGSSYVPVGDTSGMAGVGPAEDKGERVPERLGGLAGEADTGGTGREGGMAGEGDTGGTGREGGMAGEGDIHAGNGGMEGRGDTGAGNGGRAGERGSADDGGASRARRDDEGARQSVEPRDERASR